jgi:CTP synthase
MLICRVDRDAPDKILDKVASLTNVPREAVFTGPDVSTVYQVPIEFYDRHIDDLIADRFHFPRNGVKIHKYRDLVEKYVGSANLPIVEIGIIGKYENCDEAYLSLKEAVYHAGVANDVKIKIRWISAESLDQAKDLRGVWPYLSGLHGVIVAGGFGIRDIEGKIKGIQYAREKKIPFLGICLGLQCAVIEFARSLGYEKATSTEFDHNTETPVVHFIPGQESIKKKCGTMRLGAYDCIVEKDTLARSLYKKKLISERHRHRYEVNDKYAPEYAKHGFKVSGTHPDTGLIEIMELDRTVHPYFIGTQAHPEFRSRLGEPNPLLNGLVEAAVAFNKNRTLIVSETTSSVPERPAST